MITCRDLAKSYGARQVLGPLSLDIDAGEHIAVMGPSGAGKTTLLHCLAGLEAPDSGRVTISGRAWDGMTETEQADARLHRIGLLFQSPDLLAELTLLQNAALPLEFSGHSRGRAETRAGELLGELGLAAVAGSRPAQVSGGEAQRAALARALIAQPEVVFADEPTGSLDSEGRDDVLEVLTGLARARGTTLVVVTHDPVVANALDRTIFLFDGRVQERRDDG